VPALVRAWAHAPPNYSTLLPHNLLSQCHTHLQIIPHYYHIIQIILQIIPLQIIHLQIIPHVPLFAPLPSLPSFPSSLPPLPLPASIMAYGIEVRRDRRESYALGGLLTPLGLPRLVRRTRLTTSLICPYMSLMCPLYAPYMS